MIYETDTGRVMVYNGSAWVLVPPKIPAVKAVEGSTINVPTGLGTWVDLAPNDSDAYDSDTMHSTSSQQERVTFTTAGLYAIKCKGLWQSVASGSGSIRALDSAGAVIDETRMSFTNAAGTTNKQSLIVEDRFTAGDWIKFQVSHNNGSTITFGPFDIVAVYLGREA